MVCPCKGHVMQIMFPFHDIIVDVTHLPLDGMAAKLQTISLSTTRGHELINTLSRNFVDND